MIALTFKIDDSEIRALVRGRVKAVQDALIAGLVYWWERYYPERFTLAGARKYKEFERKKWNKLGRVDPRTGKFQIVGAYTNKAGARKIDSRAYAERRKLGLILQTTGRFKEESLSEFKSKKTGPNTRAIVLKGARVLNFDSRMAAEARKVFPDQIERITEIAGRAYAFTLGKAVKAENRREARAAAMAGGEARAFAMGA